MADAFAFSASWWLMVSVYFVGTASPGPSNLSIMAVAMAQGRRPALVLAAGIITGSVTWGLAAGFGLATVLATWVHALVLLKLLGGLYLLWLAYGAARAALRADASGVGAQTRSQAGSKPVTGPRNLYLRGAAMHLTNPKAILSWVATISVGLPAHAATADVLVALASCFVIGVAVFSGYALVFSTAPAQRVYTALRRWIEGALATLYTLAALRLLNAARQ